MDEIIIWQISECTKSGVDASSYKPMKQCMMKKKQTKYNARVKVLLVEVSTL